jgi:hypothetical protein
MSAGWVIPYLASIQPAIFLQKRAKFRHFVETRQRMILHISYRADYFKLSGKSLALFSQMRQIILSLLWACLEKAD